MCEKESAYTVETVQPSRNVPASQTNFSMKSLTDSRGPQQPFDLVKP